MKEIGFVNICRGLLILFVILYHIPLFIGVDGNILCAMIENLNKLYIPFFMPSFFFISGYLLNKERSILCSVKKDVLRILFPALSFSLVCLLIKSFAIGLFGKQEILNSICEFANIHYWINAFWYYWFLYALFFSKNIFLFISKLTNNKYLVLLFCTLVSFSGSWLWHKGIGFDVFYFEEGLLFSLMVCLGNMAKNVQK